MHYLPARRILVILITAVILLSASCRRMPTDDQIEDAVKGEVVAKNAPKYVTEGRKRSQRVWTMLQRFYVKREFKPAWVSDHNLSIEEFVGALCRADQEGLNPGNYNINALGRLHSAGYTKDGLQDEERAKRLAQLDVALTYAFLTYGNHLTNGYARPQWDTRADTIRMDDQLQKALSEGTLREVLTELLPAHEQYRKLKEVLAAYRRLAESGGWPAIKDPNDSTTLARRLAASGDLQTAEETAPENIVSAIKKFQARHGLAASGKVDGSTMNALNVPLEQRIRQLEINLERWRWLPTQLGDRYIMVNVPAFELQAVENGRVALRMPVVVGQEYKPTPLFSQKMTYIVLNPSWNVPAQIAKDEILPVLMTDSSYLERNRMEVVSTETREVVESSEIDWESVDPEDFPYRIRQQPGEENSLGRIKFMFPNQFDVYLHDTPAQDLFKKRRRDFSHGCVRVSKPFELAAWVLEGKDDWNPDALQQATMTDEEKTIKLDHPLPVYILYWTSWVEDNGTVSFREDLYEQDKKMLSTLPPQTRGSPEARRSCQSILEKVED